MSDAEWDATVEAFDAGHRASNPTYRAMGYNCYSYVVAFLNAVKFMGR